MSDGIQVFSFNHTIVEVEDSPKQPYSEIKYPLEVWCEMVYANPNPLADNRDEILGEVSIDEVIILDYNHQNVTEYFIDKIDDALIMKEWEVYLETRISF